MKFISALQIFVTVFFSFVIHLLQFSGYVRYYKTCYSFFFRLCNTFVTVFRLCSVLLKLLQFFVSVWYYKKKKFVTFFFSFLYYTCYVRLCITSICFTDYFTDSFHEYVLFYPLEMASPLTSVNPIPIMEKSQKGSMVPISRDGNKRCCSISQP